MTSKVNIKDPQTQEALQSLLGETKALAQDLPFYFEYCQARQPLLNKFLSMSSN